MKTKKQQFRQGDVFVERCADEIDGCTRLEPEGGRVILAHGEATGHAHALSVDAAALYEHPKTKERFLRVVRETSLLHEEHAPIKLKPGTYRVRRQREYSPTEIRNVAD